MDKKNVSIINILVAISSILLLIKAFTYKPEIEYPSAEWIALGVGQTKPDYLLGILLGISVILWIIRIAIAFEEQKVNSPAKHYNSGRVPRSIWRRCKGR